MPDQSSAEEQPKEGPKKEPETRKIKRILLVDDNLKAAEGTQAFLAEKGFDVTYFPFAAIARSHLVAELHNKEPKLPDLIIADIGGEDFTGVDLARWKKSQPALTQIPLMIYTVRPDESSFGNQKDLKKYGINSVLGKSMHIDRLYEGISQIEQLPSV